MVWLADTRTQPCIYRIEHAVGRQPPRVDARSGTAHLSSAAPLLTALPRTDLPTRQNVDQSRRRHNPIPRRRRYFPIRAPPLTDRVLGLLCPHTTTDDLERHDRSLVGRGVSLVMDMRVVIYLYLYTRRTFIVDVSRGIGMLGFGFSADVSSGVVLRVFVVRVWRCVS